jgi:hypothetical protein
MMNAINPVKLFWNKKHQILVHILQTRSQVFKWYFFEVNTYTKIDLKNKTRHTQNSSVLKVVYIFWLDNQEPYCLNCILLPCECQFRLGFSFKSQKLTGKVQIGDLRLVCCPKGLRPKFVLHCYNVLASVLVLSSCQGLR